MNKQPKLWELLAAFLPIIIGLVVWAFNLSTKQALQEEKIINLERSHTEYRSDVKEINENLKTILIKLESKQDKK